VPSGDQISALSLKNLRKTYKGVVAVDGLDITVLEGECFGLLGPNGAGKTTTLEICEGLTEPDSGIVKILGMNWKSDATELRQRLGIQLQDTQLAERLTVIETVRLFRSFYRRGLKPDDVVKLVQLEKKCGTWVGALSGGQRQCLELACALAGDPELLFLDEPTTGLDPTSRRQLWNLIEQLKLAGRTIVLTTHYMAEAEQLCDRVAIMDQGRLVAVGTPRELIASLGATYIIEFEICGDMASLRLEQLQAIKGVSRHRSEKGKLSLWVNELHASLPLVLDELARQGVALAALKTHSATLEDVFVSITGRSVGHE
jgi:ABC-2 type transport system ATP-binding protein